MPRALQPECLLVTAYGLGAAANRLALKQVLEKNENTSAADVAAADASEGRGTRHQMPGEKHR